jgi:hypothetical protein
MTFRPNDPNINRNGRPPMEVAIADIIRTELLEIDQETGKIKRDLMIERVWDLATKHPPERWAVEFIADRTEGKPIQTTITPYRDPDEVRVLG